MDRLERLRTAVRLQAQRDAIADGETPDPDDVFRVVPNRRDRRALAKKLRRLPAPRTGRPWPFVRKTGTPEHFGRWNLEGLMRDLRARGVDVHEELPDSLKEQA